MLHTSFASRAQRAHFSGAEWKSRLRRAARSLFLCSRSGSGSAGCSCHLQHSDRQEPLSLRAEALPLYLLGKRSALVPCPDCGHAVSKLAEACPSCARPLKKGASREGLFLRTLNQAVAAAFWIPAFLLLVLLGVGVVAYFLGYFAPPR